MKFLSLIFLIVITGCNSEYKTVEKKFPNGTTAIEYVYPNKENKNNYNIIEYYDNGKVAFKGFVENDKFVRIKLNSCLCWFPTNKPPIHKRVRFMMFAAIAVQSTKRIPSFRR
jgi:hypothetical protein